MNAGMRQLIIPEDLIKKISTIPEDVKTEIMAAVVLQYEPKYSELPAHFGADVTFWLWEQLKDKRGVEAVKYMDEAAEQPLAPEQNRPQRNQ